MRLLNRRRFLFAVGAALLAGNSVTCAQSRVWRIGFLAAASRQNLVDRGLYTAFLQGLDEHGYAEGKNIVIEARFAEGQYERFPVYAAELVKLNVDVIIAVPSPAIRAARDATSTIPIVFPSTGDPVGSGFAATLARPGGNITGISNSNLDVSGKTLEFLKTLVPRMSRIAILGNPGSSTEAAMVSRFANAASQLGIRSTQLKARTVAEVDNAFVVMSREKVDALIVAGDAFLNEHGRRIAGLALEARLASARIP